MGCLCVGRTDVAALVGAIRMRVKKSAGDAVSVWWKHVCDVLVGRTPRCRRCSRRRCSGLLVACGGVQAKHLLIVDQGFRLYGPVESVRDGRSAWLALSFRRVRPPGKVPGDESHVRRVVGNKRTPDDRQQSGQQLAETKFRWPENRGTTTSSGDEYDGGHHAGSAHSPRRRVSRMTGSL